MEKIPEIICGSIDRPLNIGGKEIPCYVLEDERRVLVQRGMMESLDMKQGTAGRGPGDRLLKFVSTKAIKPFVFNELEDVIKNPIKFKTEKGAIAYGYEATVLADICDAVLDSRNAGKLHYQQQHIAMQCEILVRSFARVGIIALVDEATGFQDIRDRQDLHKFLEVYLSEERLKWAKTFPDEFYKQVYRLKGWQYPKGSTKRTPLIGKITNEVVYDRLSVPVLKKLKKRNPVVPETKRRKWKHFQFLSDDIGQPDLRDHLLQLIAIMRASSNWRIFERLYKRAFQRSGDQMPLEIGEPDIE